MKIGDLVLRVCDTADCDSGPPINDFGIVIDITPSDSIFIYWASSGYTMGYSNNVYGLGGLKVVSESRR
jgi:hypothetical protein